MLEHLGGVSWAILGNLGLFLGSLLRHLGMSWAVLCLSGAVLGLYILGCLESVLRPSWACPRVSWPPESWPRASLLAPLGTFLELSWVGGLSDSLWGFSRPLGVSWGCLGNFWDNLGIVLGHLGTILGHLGAIMGPAQDHLGTILGHLGLFSALLVSSLAHRGPSCAICAILGQFHAANLAQKPIEEGPRTYPKITPKMVQQTVFFRVRF